MKRFGFHTHQLYYHMRNPTKVKYVHTPKLGNFEAPKIKDSTNVNKLA